jgi:transketolase
MQKITDISELKEIARKIRVDVIKMTNAAGSGHPGGSMSAAEIFSVLYFNIMSHRPENPEWEDRDVFILSKGHCCPGLYSAMARSGYFPIEELMTLRKLGSRLQGHPHSTVLPGLEASTGSLGQGLSIAVGCALAMKLNKKNSRVYCLMGDGEQEEGQIWEAAMSAAHYKLDNLCGIVDRNRLQIDGLCKEVMDYEPLEKKWESFGWHVITVDGHDIASLISVFEKAKEIKNKPTVIIADTIKGKGVSFMENVAIWHGQAPNDIEMKKALNDLGEKGYHNY